MKEDEKDAPLDFFEEHGGAPDVGRSPRPENINRTWALQGGIVQVVGHTRCSKKGNFRLLLQGEIGCYCPFCVPFNYGGFKQNIPILVRVRVK